MNEFVPAMGAFINIGGYFPQHSLGADIIKKCRKEPCELFGKVIYRTDSAV